MLIVVLVNVFLYRTKFAPYGECSVRLVPAKNCAFVSYVNRSAAEAAAKGLAGNLTLRGEALRVSWGRKQTGGGAPGWSGGGSGPHMSAPPGMETKAPAYAAMSALAASSGSASAPSGFAGSGFAGSGRVAPPPPPPGMKAPLYPSTLFVSCSFPLCNTLVTLLAP